MGYVRLPFPDKKRGRKYFQQFVFKTFKTRPSESNLILCLWSGVPAMLRQLVLGNQFLCEPSLHNLTKSDQAGQLGGKNRLFNHRASGCYSETIFNTKLIEDIKTNTSLAAKGALANRLQRRTTCKIQNGRQGAPKWQRGSGKVSTPRFLGILSNFR